MYKLYKSYYWIKDIWILFIHYKRIIMGNSTQCTVKEVKNDRDDVISSAQR